MEVAELRQKKDELENTINDAIRKFEKETSITITGFSITPVKDDSSFYRGVTTIKVKIDL